MYLGSLNVILHSRLNSPQHLLSHHQLPQHLPGVLQGDDLVLHLLLPPLPHHHVDPQDVRGGLDDVGQTLTELLLTVPGPSPQVGEEEEDQPGLAVRLDVGGQLGEVNTACCCRYWTEYYRGRLL